MMVLRPLVTLLALLALGTLQKPEIRAEAVCSHEGAPFVDSCFSIRGRMGASNGTPSYRIWIVGTHRLLGVTESRGCVVPPLLDSLIGVQDQVVYADFVVRPVTQEAGGVMRLVCIASATRITTRPAYFINPPSR